MSVDIKKVITDHTRYRPDHTDYYNITVVWVVQLVTNYRWSAQNSSGQGDE